MILRRRTVELLSGGRVPAGLAGLVDHVLVLGGLPCSAIGTRRSGTTVMAVGGSRDVALRRLHDRVRRTDPSA